MVKEEFEREISFPLFKGRIQARFDDPLFLKSISDCHQLLEDAGTEILLDRRNRVGVVKLPLRDGKSVEVVIKEFRSLGLGKLKTLFFSSKAFKSWQGATALVRRGIETPFPVAYLEKREKGLLTQSFFLAQRLDNVQEIRFLLRKLPEEKLHLLLAAVARFLFSCHEKGILHRDLSDGNILVKKDGEGFNFFLIDTNRIQLSEKISLPKRIKNLVRLGVPPQFQKFFLKQYLGELPAKKHVWLWYRLNKKKYSFLVEFKKKLRLRQLAQKLKIQ